MSYRVDKHVVTAHTDGHTDRQTQATTIPEGQNWPQVKRVGLEGEGMGVCAIFIKYGMLRYKNMCFMCR